MMNFHGAMCGKRCRPFVLSRPAGEGAICVQKKGLNKRRKNDRISAAPRAIAAQQGRPQRGDDAITQ
jgi:hypothetical protein